MFRDNRRKCGQKEKSMWKVNGLLLLSHMKSAWFCPEHGQNSLLGCRNVRNESACLYPLSGLCSTAEVCVCDIRSTTIPMNHWPVQTLYKTSIFLSDFEDQIGMKKKMTTTSHVSLGTRYLFLLWSLAGLLSVFLSEDQSDNTKLTPTVMQRPKYENSYIVGLFLFQTLLVIL